MQEGMRVVPAGGVWSHLERLPNGRYHQFIANTEEELWKQVQQFRLNNNLELGDISDIKRKVVGKPPDERTLRDKVTGWVANRMFQQHEFVTPEEAKRRADICVDCPLNQVKYADSCIECHSKTERDAFALRGGQSTSQDSWLGACACFGHENKTAVWLTEKSLKHRVNNMEKSPEFCWMRKLDEQPAGGVES
jgi:hypothetical protein